jgi:hypothetical protein
VDGARGVSAAPPNRIVIFADSDPRKPPHREHERFRQLGGSVQDRFAIGSNRYLGAICLSVGRFDGWTWFPAAGAFVPRIEQKESVMSKKNNKSTRVVRAEDLIAGIKKRFPNPNDSVEFGGATYTVADVLAKLQRVVDLRDGVEQAQAAAKVKLAAEEAEEPALVVVLDGFTGFVRTRFGNSADALADFGLKPRKGPAPQTAEEKAVAAAKRKATRKARNTMGPKAKKKLGK